MAGLSIKCPKCNQKMGVRTSQHVTSTVIQASLYCDKCEVRASVSAQITKLEIAEYHQVDLASEQINQK